MRRSPARSGRHPSTVAYWVNRHDLASSHAPKHAARGGLARETLEPLVTEGLSVQEIAERLGRGGTTVRYWLRKHGLVTTMPHSHRWPTARQYCSGVAASTAIRGMWLSPVAGATAARAVESKQ